MDNEKDRFGGKLQDVEKAREDQWARERDQRLLEKLRERHAAELHCPKCQSVLAPRMVNGHAVLGCPNGHGVWLDDESVKYLAKL